MKLEFDNLSELNDFLDWAKRFGKHVAHARQSAGEGVSCTGGPLPTLDEHAFDPPPAPDLTDMDPPGRVDRAAEATEPAKRKRRTKAEIEAAAAAEAKPEEAAALAEAVQQDKAAEVQTPPEGANPFEQAAAPAVDHVAAADDVPNAEPDVVTPFQHLTRGREFIAKHGMPKYLETFTKAGTDPNVMGYSAYQRGLHMAAMDELDKA